MFDAKKRIADYVSKITGRLDYDSLKQIGQIENCAYKTTKDFSNFRPAVKLLWPKINAFGIISKPKRAGSKFESKVVIGEKVNENSSGVFTKNYQFQQSWEKEPDKKELQSILNDCMLAVYEGELPPLL